MGIVKAPINKITRSKIPKTIRLEYNYVYNSLAGSQKKVLKF